MRWMLPLLSLPLAFALAASAPAPPPDADAVLRRLEREWTEHLLRQRPCDAQRWGLRGSGVALPVTRAWIDGERAWIAAFGARLDPLPGAGLSARRAAARDSLVARCARLRDSDVTRRAWEREPAMYATLAVDAVRDALVARDACGSARRLSRRLRIVPELLRSARIHLAGPSPGAVAAGIGRFEEALDLYRSGIPAGTLGCKDAYAQADLAQADSLAVRAASEFLLFLREDLAPRAR